MALALSAAQGVCFKKCRFRFCDNKSSFLLPLRPNEPFTGPICAKWSTRIGHIAGTGEALVVRKFSDPFEISKLAPARPFAKSFFKTYHLEDTAFSGVGHEDLKPLQAEIIHDKCIALPITSYQEIDAAGNVVRNVEDETAPLTNCIAFKIYTK